MLPWDGFQLNT